MILKELFFASEWGFLRLALLLGLLVSPAIGAVGTMVVTKRISSLAGAIAHAALGGFGMALFCNRVLNCTWCTPLFGAVIGALGASIIVWAATAFAKERSDTVIGTTWALGMSIGLLFLDRTPGYVDWQSYLFGNILLLSEQDIYWTLLLDAAVLLPTVIFFPMLLTVSFDQTYAALRGIKTELFELVLLTLTALTIVLLINLVGIMLVIALLALPAAAANCCTIHLKSMMLLTALFNAVIITAGLLTGCWLEMPAGPLIVVIAGIFYLLSLLWKSHRTSGGK